MKTHQPPKNTNRLRYSKRESVCNTRRDRTLLVSMLTRNFLLWGLNELLNHHDDFYTALAEGCALGRGVSFAS